MKKVFDDIFIKHLPTIDLHGEDTNVSKMLVNDFINDNYLLKKEKVVIIHGKGQGLVKGAVHESLKNNKKVKKYYLYNGNLGCTIAEIDL